MLVKTVKTPQARPSVLLLRIATDWVTGGCELSQIADNKCLMYSRFLSLLTFVNQSISFVTFYFCLKLKSKGTRYAELVYFIQG